MRTESHVRSLFGLVCNACEGISAFGSGSTLAAVSSMFRPARSHIACSTAPKFAYHSAKHRQLAKVSPLVRRASGKATPGSETISSSRRSLLFAILGSSSAAAAYFLWPDTSRSAPTYANVALSPAHFTPVTVTATEPCLDPNTRLITLTVPRQSLPPLRESIFAPVWSIFIKDDDIQVERPYTPLEGIDEDGRMKFWVKRYPKGEVGRWLHTKKVGDQIEIRGPLQTWRWQDNEWDEIVMVRVY